MYTTPSQQLPFDPTRLAHPFLAIDQNRPPCVPPYQCENFLGPYLSYIAFLLQTEIQARSQENPLRTFAFNMLAANGFNNQDFAELFAATVDHVAMCLMQRQYGTPDEAAINLSPIMVDMAVAGFVQDFPQLTQFINQEVYYSVQETTANQQRFAAARRQFRYQNPVFGYGQQQQQQQRPYQGAQQQGYPQQQQYRPGGYQVPGHMQQGGMPVGAAPAPFRQRGPVGATSLSRPPQAPEQETGMQRPVSPMGTSKYAKMLKDVEDVRVKEAPQPYQSPNLPPQQEAPNDLLRQPFTPRTEQAMNSQQPYNQAPLEADGSFLIPEVQSTYVWKPTAEQPYRPIYHPSCEQRMHRIFPDGRVVVEVHPLQLSNMDYEKHNVPNVFGKPREGVNYDQLRALGKFAEGAREVAQRFEWEQEATGDDEAASAAQAKLNEDPVSVVINENWAADVSETSIMLNAGIDRLAHNATAEKPADVYRVNAYLAEPVLCVDDQSAFLRRISESRSYLELAEKLHGAGSEADVGLVEAITRRCIVMLNRVLCLHLSIPKDQLQLDNEFDAATLQELEAVLQADFGPAVYKAYKDKQREHIASVFMLEDGPGFKTAVEQLSEQLIDTSKFPEGKGPHLALMSSKISFTLLDMYIHDIDIDFDTDTGSLLTERNAGDFYKVVQDLFAKAKADGGNGIFYRHLFQTNDGAVMEVVEGDIVAGSYLISRAPKAWLG